MVAALLRVAGVTADQAESNGSLRRVYDSRQLQADCQEPGSAPEPYALGNRVWATFTIFTWVYMSKVNATCVCAASASTAASSEYCLMVVVVGDFIGCEFARRGVRQRRSPARRRGKALGLIDGSFL